MVSKKTEINLIVQVIISASFFVGGLVFSVGVFKEQPLFGVYYLAELIIPVTSALFGFYLVPKYFLILKKWLEELVVNTIYRLVGDFYTQYTKKLEENRKEREKAKKIQAKYDMQEKLKDGVLVDTSVLIDGRVLKIAQTGFFLYSLIIPKKVIEELHLLADNKRDTKRQKGRRGLDLINELKKATKVIVLTAGINNGANASSATLGGATDNAEVADADAELLALAKRYKLKIMTLDFNLAKVAKVSSIKTINLNELAQALKPEYIPGDVLNVKIMQEGKESGQGLGYLDDGTMLVVAGASDKVGNELDVVVSKLIQTNAGTMIFCDVL